MSGIRALDSLSGKISGESVLKGTLSGIESLNGVKQCIGKCRKVVYFLTIPTLHR